MKKIYSILISVVLVFSMFSSIAFAEEEEIPDYSAEPAVETQIDEEEEIIDSGTFEIEQEIADIEPEENENNDELLMEYMELSVSDSSEPVYSVFGLNHLTGINIKVYGLLKACVSKVASGEESSTVFTFHVSDLGLNGRYSAADLGVSAVVSNGAVTSEAKTAMKAKLQEINLSRVNTALQFDCPAEFYWYEKSKGCSMQSSIGMGATYDYSLGEYVMYFSDTTMVQFSYTVAEDYAVNHASGTYVVDSSVIDSIQTAIDHANDIITTHANEADYQKLVSYKDEICSAVKYNTAAANNNYTYNYGNPWQLIWVFDEDSTTNVVCEGYAKAFQFLCDGSTFRSHQVESRIVTGVMAGGTGAGGHMWNVVTMNDGQNYLVDVTNCDGGTIGYPNKLFLVGYGSGSVAAGYSIPISGQSTMTFSYDDSTRANYSYEELTIASQKFDPSFVPVEFYTITFEDEDGSILLEGVYEYGSDAAAIAKPADPKKDPEEDGHYVFIGWFPAITTVTGDTTYTAEYAFEYHQPGEAVIKNRVEATCEEAGSYEEVLYCSVCGKEISSEIKTIPATGHSWGEWYVITAATEETEGLESRDCINDPTHTETRAIPKLAHKHDMQKIDAKEATCSAEGNFEYYICKGCGEYFNDEAGIEEIERDSWIIPKEPHTVVIIPGKEATCTESGLTEGSTCSVCGETLIAQEVIPSKGHSYGEWIVTKEATCTAAGSQESICTDCGHIMEEPVSAIGHSWNIEYTIEREATCTETGMKYIHCVACGEVQSGSEIIIPAKGHSYGDLIITKEATCTEAGTGEKDCSTCGHRVTETIPAAGHDWGEWYVITAASEEADGLEGRSCMRDESHTETRVIPKFAHKHTMEKTARKEATCTQEGISEYWTCTGCGEYFADEAGTKEIEKDRWILPKKEHTPQYIPGKAADCTESGLTEGSMCSSCGVILIEQEAIPAKGHSYGEWIIVKEADCISAGSRKIVCEDCGHTVEENIPAKGHSWNTEYTMDREVSCTETGMKSIHCAACGAVQSGTEIIIPAKGHAMKKTAAREATFTEDGNSEYWMCEHCGKYFADEDGLQEIARNSWVIPKKQDRYNHYTGLVNDEGTLTYLTDGLPDTSVSGIYKYTDVWCYVKNGYVDTSYEGVEQNQYGWWKIEGGRVNFGFNGLAANAYGTWYLKDGKVDFSYQGFAAGTAKGKAAWWYVEGGQVKFNKTDILSGTANTAANQTGVSGWWYVKGSMVTGENTVAKNANGWWVIRNGKVDFGYTGFAANDNGWWYIEKGQVNFRKNDILGGKANTDPKANGEDGWWLIRGGQVVNETTVANNANGWWYVKNGKVVFTHNGVERNANGWWCIHSGKVDFGYTGFESNANGWWYIEKGQVTFKKNDVISGKAHSDPNAGAEDGWWNVKGSQVVKGPTVAQNAYGWWYIDEAGKVNFSFRGLEKNDYGTWYLEGGKVNFNFNGSYNGYRIVNGKVQ